MAGAESAATAGLCVGISTAVLHSLLSQSVSGAIVGAQAELHPVVLLAAVATFIAAVMLPYIHLRNCGVGGVGEQQILEVMMFFLICTSTALLDLFLFMQPGPIQQDEVLLVVAALQLLPPAAAVTFFLAITLIYVHAVTSARGGSGGAANQQKVAAMVELLHVMTVAATLITGLLSFIAVVLVFDTK